MKSLKGDAAIATRGAIQTRYAFSPNIQDQDRVLS
jgi:hypothetical protein